MDVETLLKRWLAYIGEERDEHATLWSKSSHRIFSSRVLLNLILFHFILSTVPLFYKEDAVSAIGTLTTVIASYSAVMSFTFFFNKKYAMGLILETLIVASKDVSKTADTYSQDEIQRAARLAFGLCRFVRWYSVVVVLFMFVPTLLTGKQQIEVAWPYVHQTEGLITATIFQLILIGPLMTCWQGFFTLSASINMCATALFNAVGRSFQESECDERVVRDLVRKHAVLSGTVQAANDLFAPYFVHSLFPTLVVPLLVAFSVIAGQPDFFVISVLPSIIVIFLPTCALGQQLEDASVSVGNRVYFGRWLESSPATRKLYLNVMTAANTPQTIPVDFLGALNHHTFQTALKSWFSYLNMLLKIMA